MPLLDLNYFVGIGNNKGQAMAITNINNQIATNTDPSTKNYYRNILEQYKKLISKPPEPSFSSPVLNRGHNYGGKKTKTRRKSKRHSMRKKRHTGRRRK